MHLFTLVFPSVYETFWIDDHEKVFVIVNFFYFLISLVTNGREVILLDNNDSRNIEKKKQNRYFCKLMRLGLTNRIDDDSDSKPVDLDHRIWSDSKSNDEIDRV